MRLFKRLPFAAKLILIACIPLAFVIYLGIQLYKEKGEHVRNLNVYRARIDLSADLAGLIDNLQEERKYSFDYAMTHTNREQLDAQRPRTDYFIQLLRQNKSPDLFGFTTYTNLDELPDIRNDIDTADVSPQGVMHYYSNMIFRLNTLNAVPIAGSPGLDTLYSDLTAQKLLSEMITYLGIIRSNIYNVLYTKQYMVETLIGTTGTHDVYKSYEKEFLLKAPPEIAKDYQVIRASAALDSTISYIDSLFSSFSFDSTYTAQSWWDVSNRGSDELRALQQRTWANIIMQLKRIVVKEQISRDSTLIILIIILLLVCGVVAYTIMTISRSLDRLRKAAQKIAKGITGLSIDTSQPDIIGELAACIKEIDKNNQVLAEAAATIGRGNFNVSVEPRSKQDMLGNAIVKMKEELDQYREEMEQLVRQRTEELNRSNEDLQQFAHVASHDLREPLRKITTFSSRLIDEHQDMLNERGRQYLDKIQHTSARMSRMVEDVLNYSIANTYDQVFETVDLNELIDGIEDDLEITILKKKATIKYGALPKIQGIPILIYQLFYNLITNALKFSKSDTPPKIIIRQVQPSAEELKQVNKANAASFVKIEVEDNGIGFDQEYANRMFAAFTRLNSKEQYEGTGLGLALCKKIVLRHGGMIEAKGKKGEGAVFSILLPASHEG